MAESCDVVVVGAGLVGAVAALGIARGGRSVMLFERERPVIRPGRFGMDIRNVAVSPASQKLLVDLGVWDGLQAAAFSGMQVWEEQGTESIEFTAATVARSELGWIIENGPTVDALWQALDKQDGVSLRLGESLEMVSGSAAGVRLQTSTAEYSAQLLIGIDGARSKVRELVGAELDVKPTGHHALATLIETELPHAGVAFQRFLLDGPLALLPTCQPNVSAVVWSQNEAAARARQSLAGDAFCEEIGAASEYRLGKVRCVDERAVFPLAQQLVRHFNPAPGVLLLGDAAHVLHPLAGLGVNVGFEDVRALLKRLAMIPLDVDAGQAGLWRSFARQRRTRSQIMLGLMAGFRSVYAQNDPLLQWARNVGVGWLNRTPAIKRQLMKEALGLGPLAQRL